MKSYTHNARRWFRNTNERFGTTTEAFEAVDIDEFVADGHGFCRDCAKAEYNYLEDGDDPIDEDRAGFIARRTQELMAEYRSGVVECDADGNDLEGDGGGEAGDEDEAELIRINGTQTYSAAQIKYHYNGASITWHRCELLERQGFRFIPGNNPGLGRTKKWQYNVPVRVAQTNSRYHGMSVQTLWAVRENELSPEVDFSGWNG